MDKAQLSNETRGREQEAPAKNEEELLPCIVSKA